MKVEAGVLSWDENFGGLVVGGGTVLGVFRPFRFLLVLVLVLVLVLLLRRPRGSLDEDRHVGVGDTGDDNVLQRTGAASWDGLPYLCSNVDDDVSQRSACAYPSA